jgi:prepilin-type N-terminal cleavage/methylation domain-containing protein
MLRINKQGFTLIELMVVIVIIGVLASLAIPRFTEASAKAKAAEVPRVLSSFESAYLAAVAERGEEAVTADDLIFKEDAVNADSKWFGYVVTVASGQCVATSTSKLGAAPASSNLTTVHQTDDSFLHSGTETLLKLVPNFKPKTTTP